MININYLPPALYTLFYQFILVFLDQYTLFAGGTVGNSFSSNVYILTGRYSIYTFPDFKSGIDEFVCFMKLVSSLSGKSSLAWAPLDYFRMMAEWSV